MESKYIRQSGIVDGSKVMAARVTLIGAGAVGSFAALTLAKLGVLNITAFDEDGVSGHNVPNQFFRNDDAINKEFKVVALDQIIRQFTDGVVETKIEYYKDQPLNEYVVCAPDSMKVRKMVWNQFLKSDTARVLIEARMGGEVGIVYTITKQVGTDGKMSISAGDLKFYNEVLHSDEESSPLPCTARAVIYNVLMIASLICRQFKGSVMGEQVKRELVFDMVNLMFMDRE